MLLAAALIRPSAELSVCVKVLIHICRKCTCTVLQMTSRALHMLVSKMGHWAHNHSMHSIVGMEVAYCHSVSTHSHYIIHENTAQKLCENAWLGCEEYCIIPVYVAQ